jgi:hypothetical protein
LDTVKRLEAAAEVSGLLERGSRRPQASMTDDIERTAAASGERSGPTSPARTSVIKRTSAPATEDGTRWQVQLSGAPSPSWLEFFKQAGEASPPPAAASQRPQRVTFDQASIVFKSDEDHVERWIEGIDRWIAWADERYVMSLEEESRQRSLRLDDEARKRERILRLNDRFKNL